MDEERFNDQFENQGRFEFIIRSLKDSVQLKPPDGFTARVMDRLPEAGTGVWARVWGSLKHPRESGLSAYRAPFAEADENKCSLYYFIMASAHFLAALILAVGIRGHVQVGPAWTWLELQPWLFFILADGFCIFGLWVRQDGVTSLKAARLAAFVYIEIMVIDGLIPLIMFRSNLFESHFIGLAVGGSVLGWFLAGTVHNRLKGHEPGSFLRT